MFRKYFSSYWIRSAFYSFLQRFSVTFFGFVNFIVLIRSLSHEQMGVWALFLTITTIFESTKSGLLKNAHIRFVTATGTEADHVAVASTSFLINAAITVVGVLLIAFFGPWVSRTLNAGAELSTTLQWFIPGMIAMVFFSHFEAVQQSFLDFKGVFLGAFTRQVLFFSIIAAHLLLKIPFTLAHLALYQSLCIASGTVVLFFLTKKYLRFRFHASMAWAKKITGYGGYIFGSGILSNIFASVDQLLTAKVISGKAVAYYSAAGRINNFIDIPSFAAAEILFPKVSQSSVEEGSQRVKYLFERMVAILLSFTVPASLVVFLFPKLVITLIAGPSYVAAAPILQLYVATGLMRPFLNQAGNILNSIGKPGLCFAANAVSLVINLAVNYLCLRQFGLYGAAIGTLVTHVIGTVLWYVIMRKEVGFRLSSLWQHVREVFRQLAQLVLKQKKTEVSYES